VTGQGRYVDDIAVEGLLHAVFVRSIEAHATIGAISVDSASLGDARVYTAADLGLTAPMPNQNPSPIITQSIQAPPLAFEEVCYVGQPIAVVVADSVAAAIDGAEAVQVDYDPLPRWWTTTLHWLRTPHSCMPARPRTWWPLSPPVTESSTRHSPRPIAP